jgi:hypothetical protein
MKGHLKFPGGWDVDIFEGYYLAYHGSISNLNFILPQKKATTTTTNRCF